ncbi:MAG: hypothetical protein L0216_20310 [Planctomycetales bacterium]|nr:hypothetical protein [Planctomycetales bacterium]
MGERRVTIRVRGVKPALETTVILSAHERTTRWVVSVRFPPDVKDAARWPGLGSPARTEMFWIGPSEDEAFRTAESWFREHYDVVGGPPPQG